MGIMIFAALSTTAGALHNTMSFLAAHPDVGQKIYEEQKVRWSAGSTIRDLSP